MDKETKERLGEIREVIKKYGFDKILGQSAKSKLHPKDDDEESSDILLDNEITENVIYEKLLNDKLSTNLGYVYENVIAQMLRATGKNLFYHTIPYAEGKKYYEIDFLITDKHKISPIEVKSSGYKTHKSFHL